FFVLSLAGTEQAPLVIPPPGPLRGGGGRYAPILQVEMPAFFVLSLAGTEQAPLVIPPPGPLRGGGGRYAPILQVEMPAFFVGMIVASLNIIFRPGVMLKGDMI
ncbi:MAG: hypothetical protein PHP30_07920, partial [Bacteroidales bacterium]|nr:hypothetical protein [Bacteroidales bacterium]MDD3990004.1 hypothetical protein [Bacteroidales bacterium]